MKVLIVGGSRGIGFELAHQYRAAGNEVSVTARSETALAELAGIGCRAIAVDVTLATSVDAFAREIQGASFDLAVFCAGVYGPRTGALAVPTAADFDAVMHTNVLGAMRILPLIGPLLRPAAVLAVLSSQMGSIGARGDSSGWLYRASKAALNSVLKDMSLALSPRAVCVALHPGWVRTAMGGATATLSVERSASDLRRLLGSLQASDNGSFLDHDGRSIAW